MSVAPLTTPLTVLLKIKHPVMLAGMCTLVRHPPACTSAGYTPAFLKSQIAELKAELTDKKAPFGVDLLLPQVRILIPRGDPSGVRFTTFSDILKYYSGPIYHTAREVSSGKAHGSNFADTGGQLPELIDIIIAEGASLFVCAVGVPPVWAVEKLHKAGIPVMNMVGAPKHVAKALAQGCDIICAQGGEGGGHTGDVPASILIPACVDECRGKKSPLTGGPVLVVGAGGIYNGKGLAASLAYGAAGVWVGTRFICAEEAGASKAHQDAVLTAGHNDTIRTIIFTGRPLRIRKNPFVLDWEENRQEEIKELTGKGKLPVGMDTEERPHLMGSVSAMVQTIEPAKKIVDDMVKEAAIILRNNAKLVNPQAKL
ncbi:nitronate monooxygenase, partial [Phenoliferia sp. Uapishka_3]